MKQLVPGFITVRTKKLTAPVIKVIKVIKAGVSLLWGGLLRTCGQEVRSWDLLLLVQLQSEQETTPGACPSLGGHARMNWVTPNHSFALLFLSS